MWGFFDPKLLEKLEEASGDGDSEITDWFVWEGTSKGTTPKPLNQRFIPSPAPIPGFMP